MHTKLLLKNLKKRDHLEGLGVDRMTIFKWISKKLSGRVCTGFIWLRIGTSDWLTMLFFWVVTPCRLVGRYHPEDSNCNVFRNVL
jgi:hypothetical protein